MRSLGFLRLMAGDVAATETDKQTTVILIKIHKTLTYKYAYTYIYLENLTNSV